MPWRRGLSRSGRNALIVGFLVALFAAPLAARADAKKRPKPVRVPYTVSINFVGTHEQKDATGGFRSDEKAAWAGTSTPFALVRTRTKRKPLYRIAPYGGTLPQITILGPVAVKGQGSLVTPVGCSVSWTVSEGEGAAARAQLSLFANRMRINMAFEGTAFMHFAWNTCSTASGEASCESWCVPIPREDASSEAFWEARGRINSKKIKLGEAFTLRVTRDPGTDPSLIVVTPTGATTVYQQWTFDWTLRFTPAHP